jgi:lysophospholipase L1-like esterase
MSAGDNTGCRLGVLAFGDSITNGGGELQWGVALQSWAMWTARGLGLPYSPYAVDGAIAADVVDRQIPLFQRVSAGADSRYDLGCVYAGTNDVRIPGFNAGALEQQLDTAFGFVAERCERTLTATIPLDMGRPRSPAQVAAANAAIKRAAARHGTLVVDLQGFKGRGVMMADYVHPTALGQITIAERALDLLAADGADVRIRPSMLVSYSVGWQGRVRGELTYGYRSAKELARTLRASRRG